MSDTTHSDRLHKPIPRRPFSLTSTPDTNHSRPASPALTDNLSSPSLAPANADDPTSPPPRSRSILNLTSSTLLGIYSRTGYHPDRDDITTPTTPWGTGSETPAEGLSRYGSQPDETGLGIDPLVWQDKSRRRRSSVLDTSARRTRQRELARGHGIKRKELRNFWAPLLLRIVVLGGVGWCYGVLISHLHDKQQLAPVQLDGIPHHSRAYLVFWSLVAVALGSLLPWLDHFWESGGAEAISDDTEPDARSSQKNADQSKRQGRGGRGPRWNDVVRSIGALVGIAFAIKRVPWQSTLQVSLTLALLNPAIWYLLDQTSPGFILSLAVSLTGTALCLAINPDLIPPPSSTGAFKASASSTINSTGHRAIGAATEAGGLFSHESIGVATWIASVLFISSICFGNIGRRL